MIEGKSRRKTEGRKAEGNLVSLKGGLFENTVSEEKRIKQQSVLKCEDNIKRADIQVRGFKRAWEHQWNNAYLFISLKNCKTCHQIQKVEGI